MSVNLISNGLNFSECTAHGACSISPNASSLQEMMIILLRQAAFYALKLEGLGIKNDDIITDIVEEIAAIDSLGEYSEHETLSVYSKFYGYFINLKNLYKLKCKENNLACEDIKNKIVLTPDSNLASIINQGEKAFRDKYKKISEKQRELSEILFGVMKGVCSNIITYKDLDRVYEPACHGVLSAFSLLSGMKIATSKIMTKLNELVGINLEMLKLIYNAETELYGRVSETEVSLSTRPSKAIMVSGSSLTDLYAVLKMTYDKDIDVYSNGNLLIAHSYPKFREFENFRGHFGSDVDSLIMDLAVFPGAILLTKNETQNLEYLYRGRLFTTDTIAPKGVAKIEGNDLSPLLESAMKSRGFKTGRKKDTVSIGFNHDRLDAELDKIGADFRSGKFKHLVLVGFSGDTEKQAEYFKKIFSRLPGNVYLISFSYKTDCKNCLTLNTGRSYSLIYSVSEELFSKIPVAPENVSIFLSRCDVRSLSNIISFKNKGFKNVFLSNCSPRVINPATLNAFRKIFHVRETSTPKKDLDIILSGV